MLICKREICYRKGQWLKFKHFREKVRITNKAKKKSFLSNIVKPASRKDWTHLKRSAGMTSNSAVIPVSVNEISDYFSSVYIEGTESLEHIDLNENCNPIEVTADEVRMYMQKFNKNRGAEKWPVHGSRACPSGTQGTSRL